MGLEVALPFLRWLFLFDTGHPGRLTSRREVSSFALGRCLGVKNENGI
jgi:hypothetical protein